MRQHTVSGVSECVGIGVHTGREVRLRIRPAPPKSGVVFVRTDITDRSNRIRAHWSNVRSTQYAVTLQNSEGASVMMVEHLLSALYGLGVDNVVVELDGPEAPILDGSAAEYCALIHSAGLAAQPVERQRIRVLERVDLVCGDKRASIMPCEAETLTIRASIDYDEPGIGRQRTEIELLDGVYEREIALARTFALKRDLKKLAAAGLARGGSLENAVLVDNDKILNPDGLRRPDEFVRHKVLDIVGDLSLAGGPIAGLYEASKPGHSMNAELVSMLMSQTSAWVWEPASVIDDSVRGGAELR